MTPEELAQITHVVETTISETTNAAKLEIKEAIESHSIGDDHRFVQSLITKEERKAERNERLKGNFFFWLCITCTSAIGLAVWQFFVRAVKQ